MQLTAARGRWLCSEHPPAGKWLAVGAILVLQGYLVLAPSSASAAGAS